MINQRNDITQISRCKSLIWRELISDIKKIISFLWFVEILNCVLAKLNVTGNSTGNVTVNVTGNVTGKVTGKVTGNVTF